jgi:hypothetical protein
MRARLEHLEHIKKKDGALQYENGVYVSTFLLSELEGNLNSTRKRSHSSRSHSSKKSKRKSVRSRGHKSVSKKKRIV